MAYTNAGGRAAERFEGAVWAGAGFTAARADNAVLDVRDRIDAQRRADHAALAAARVEALRDMARNQVELLARERGNAADLTEQLVTAKCSAADAEDRVEALEDEVASLRRQLREARAH